MVLEGPSTNFPLAGQAKKQTAVANSSPAGTPICTQLPYRPRLPLWPSLYAGRSPCRTPQDTAGSWAVIAELPSQILLELFTLLWYHII